LRTEALNALLLILGMLFHPYSGENPAALLSSADEAFGKMDYPNAILLYESLLGNTPDDPVVLWKAARACVCQGEPFEDQRRIDFCKKAEGFAKRCIEASPNTAEGHTWLAAAYGYLALHEGNKRQVELSRAILDETAKALALNPRDDAALSIRGSLYRALGNVGWLQRQMAGIFIGGLPDGGFAEAEQCLLQAISLAPDVMRHRYELGVLYNDWGRRDDARKAFEGAVNLPVRVAIDVPRLEKTKTYLESLR
jgi:tetratricopeptide (TPR) repeat protein